MVSFIIIICIGIAVWHWGSGGVSTFASAATISPSGSPLSSWGGNASYRRNEDIPIMGDNFRRRPKEGGRSRPRNLRRRSKRSRRRRQDGATDDDPYDASDDGDDPPLFFLDESDDDQLRGRHVNDRQRKRRRLNGQHLDLDSFRRWALDKTGVHIPRLNLHFDPITILKIRKSWPIPGAIIRVGADFETHRLGGGLWRLRGCVEDKLIGGRFTIKERKHGDDRAVLMEYSKSWLFAGVGKFK